MIRITGILVAAMVWGTLSFGAVYPWGYWPLAVGCAAIGLWAIVVTRAWRQPRPRRLAFALSGVAIALVVQIIPLPYAWFQRLSPAGDAALRQLRVGWAVQPPAWHSLSIAPESTLTALLLFIAFGLLLVGLMRAVSYMPIHWVVEQLTIFGAVLAVFGIVQRVIGGPSDLLVYGFWRPGGFATPFGPFINRNHFAGWMLLVLPTTVAAASASVMKARGPFRGDWRSWMRWLLQPDASRFLFTAVAILVMATSLVLTGSRSGLISFIVALAVLAAFGAARARGRLRRVLPVFYLAVLLVAAVSWAGVSATAARFDQASVEFAERMAVWRDTSTIIRDFPIAGTGMGAYGMAMLGYQTAARHSIYVQAHNEYLQVLAEGGVLVAVPVVIVLGVIAVTIRHRFLGVENLETSWLRAGAVAGLAGIATQSMLEFSLQMPGNAMMFVFLLAVALHRPSTTHAPRV